MQMQEISSEYLKSLTGRVVRVYKGGPEAKWGTLLAVNGDHLVIQTEQDGVIYYNVRHIKSISEDSKSTTLPPNDNADNEVEHIRSDSFDTLIGELKGQYVRLDRGGPESRRGRLISVGKDHLVLETDKEGVVYYNLEHIKSISLAINDNQNKEQNSESNNQSANNNMNNSLPSYLEAGDFKELLKTIGSQPHWVKINRGGPESMEGVLIPTNSTDDYFTLIINHEVIRISTYHIRNISIGQKSKQNNNQENNSQQNVQSSNSQNQSNQENSNNENSGNNKNNKQKNRTSREARYVTFSNKSN